MSPDDITRGADVIAARDDGTRKHQRVIPQSYDSGVATDCSATNPLPVREPLPSSIAAFGPPATQPTTTRQALVTSRAARRSVEVYNNGSQTLYCGDNTVTVANGFPLPAGASKVFLTAAAVYGIVASGMADARVWDD